MTAPSAPSEFDFAPPGDSGNYFTPKNLIGYPILIKAVHEVDRHWDNLKNNRQGGEVDRVRFDWVNLADPAGVNAELNIDNYNTHVGIVTRLKQYVGTPKMVLARVGQLPPAQAGQSGAFILEAADQDPAVVAAATAWLRNWEAKRFAPPAAPQAAPAVAPVAPVTPTAPVGMNQVPSIPASAPAPLVAPAVAAPAPAQYLGNTPVGQGMVAAPPVAPAPVAAPAGPLPVVPGMTPEQVQTLINGGADMAAITQLATSLGAQAVPAAG